MVTRHEVSEEPIKRFWTDYPMIFYGMDPDSDAPEKIFQFMEESMRDSGRLFQDRGKPLLSRYIDYERLKGKEILEIGFGTGWLLNELILSGAIVHGIDLSQSHYELCKYRFRDQDIDVRVGSAEDLPFDDNAFDFVAAWGVMHHTSNDKRFIDEVYRVMRPGGQCFLMVYRKGGIKYYWTKLFRLGVLKGQLARHRFDIESFMNSVTDVHYDESPGPPISRHYMRADLQRLFRRFSAINLQISGSWRELDNFPAGRLPLTNWLCNDAAREWLIHKVGGFWLVNLTK